MWLKQSTAVTIRLGPFLDKTDGVTEETALTPTVEVSKAHAAYAARNSATAIAHDSNGWYSVELNTTDTGTVGPLTVKSDDAANHLPVWREFLVVPAHVYDGLVAGTDKLQVDTVEWLGTAVATPTVAGVPEVDPTHWNGTAVATPDTAGYPKITIKDGTGTGELDTASGQVIASSVVGSVGSVTAGVTLAASAVQAVWDALTSALTTSGSIGKMLVDRIDATISSRSTYAGGDTAGTTTLLARITALLQTKAEADTAHGLLATAAALAVVDGIVDDILVDTGTTLQAELDGIQADTENIQTRLPAALVGGRMDASVGAMASDVITAVALAGDAGVEIAAAVWDRILTGATHNIAGSAGRRVRELGASSVHAGTAQAGAAGTITLDAGASATSETYSGNLIVITAGAGAGQARVIVEYNGTTKVASVSLAWTTAPDNTSEFQVVADHQMDVTDHGTAQAGAASTITLATTASAVDDIYNGQIVLIRTSNGAGQARLITDYVGSTRVATVSLAWAVQPTSASVYAIIPAGRSIVDSFTDGAITAAAFATDAVEEIADGVWNEAIADHLASGSTGEALSAAGSAGDPWITALPGTYEEGTAGAILGGIIIPSNADIAESVVSIVIGDGADGPITPSAVLLAVLDYIENYDAATGEDLTELLADVTAVIPSNADIAEAAVSIVIEEGANGPVTPAMILRAVLAYFSGDVDGGGTSQIDYLSQDGLRVRISQRAVDEYGNREGSILDLDA